MSLRLLLLALPLSLVSGWSQQQPEECQVLKTRLDAFLAKNNPYRAGGSRATIKMVEEEFGKPPRVEPGNLAEFTNLLYPLDGCVGKVVVDSNGIVLSTSLSTVPLIPASQTQLIEQIENTEKKLRELRSQIEGIEALKATFLKQAAEFPPNAPPVQKQGAPSVIAAADASYTEGHFEAAADAYTKALGVSPSNANTLLMRGYCYHKLGRLNDAIQDYGESIRLSPTPVAYSNRAIAYLRTGRPEEALSDFNLAKHILNGDTGNAATSASSSSGTPSGSGSSGSSKGGPVSVKGYTRKDGTYVKPHTRSAPHR